MVGWKITCTVYRGLVRWKNECIVYRWMVRWKIAYCIHMDSEVEEWIYCIHEAGVADACIVFKRWWSGRLPVLYTGGTMR